MDLEQQFSALKKDVRSLLISAKSGLSPTQLMTDYQRMLGQPIPLRSLGYRSLQDMVKDMPDVVYVDFDRVGSIVLKAVGDETTKGIEHLVAKQRAPKQRTCAWNAHTHYPNLKRQTQLPLLRRGYAPPVLPAQLRSQLRVLLCQGPVALSQLEQRFASLFGKPLHVTHYGFYSIAEMLVAAADFILVKQSRIGSLLVLKSPVAPMKQTSTNQSLQATRPPLNPVRLEKPLLTVKKEPPKVAVTGCVPEVVKHSDQDSRQEAKSFEKSISKLEEELRERIMEIGDAGTVSPELKEKLQQVVSDSSEGILVQNFPLAFKKHFGEDLPVAQCGFQSVTEMVGALNDTLYLKPGPEREGGLLIVSDIKQENIQPGGASLSRYTIADFYPPLSVSSHGLMVPPDAVQCQKLHPPTKWKERDLAPVLVQCVESPSHFYVRFCENKEARALDSMMIEMRNCYSRSDVLRHYQLQEAFVRPGQVCCVATKNMWYYRVVIHQVLEHNQVEVYFADFGDLTIVDRSHLCFLKSCYAVLPAQAVLSSLVGVRPVSGRWTSRAVSFFLHLCTDGTLVGAIHCYKEGVMQLFLCDTHTEEDVYIHSALMINGHALACAPSVSAMTGQFNPVTAFFGKGELEEVQTVGPSLHLSTSVSLETDQNHLDEDETPPELELIDAVNKLEISSPLCKDPLSFHSWDKGWILDSVTEQLKADADDQESRHETVPLSGGFEETSPPLSKSAPTEKEGHSALQTLNIPTTVVSCKPTIESSRIVTLFASGELLSRHGLLLQHASPLALTPAARLAAGSHVFGW
ncbi:tudor domain-containing protein 5 [Denticeps clupeoides]|uniref:tudor domain-containing protein 5 n=1 Tax=Denticeps clupeoides TaxID=299321 RepID=UPI0010A33DC1|nr:tudor domain-containing protein 5 [Denticeps clupeoides]